jgi:hypothetical protein
MPFSLRRPASSITISSNGFMLILTLAMSTPCRRIRLAVRERHQPIEPAES